ncbi:hypothetical protein AX760_24265 [Pararhizobium antarcticum]|uniref:Uronate isomerase n=1 Tax=Pararhizobium antarcticum TaxID=1798805 RepID=A0A657LLX2_9HYPH|nr:hypothetical protein AX760_24265 [Pararhizobium antarcticum]
MRAIARQLYDSVKDLPLICPHGHTDPRWFALNEQFSDATSLFVTSDPYILRLLHGHGVPLEAVGGHFAMRGLRQQITATRQL